jgi:hypothetical protein
MRPIRVDFSSVAGIYVGWVAGSFEPAVDVEDRSFDFSGECVFEGTISAANVADDVHGVWLVDTGGASCGA